MTGMANQHPVYLLPRKERYPDKSCRGFPYTNCLILPRRGEWTRTL